jgi:hypothetical protein
MRYRRRIVAADPVASRHIVDGSRPTDSALCLRDGDRQGAEMIENSFSDRVLHARAESRQYAGHD